MSKISDALHGAADDAPVDGVQLSAVKAAGRVSRRRALRTGVPGVVGAGAIALLAFGVVIPNLGDAGRNGDESAAMGLPEAGGFGEDSAADGSSLAFGLCGSTLESGAYGEPAASLDVALLGDGEELQPGDTVGYRTTLSGTADGTFTTFGADAFVLWDGIVVGSASYGRDEVSELTQITLTGDAVVDVESDLALVNCWDGEPLPAGTYELVASQEFWADAVMDEPTLDPGEPTVSPDEPVTEPDEPGQSTDPVEPTVPPTEESASSGPADANDSVSTTNSGDGASGSTGSAASGPASGAPSFRVVSEPAMLVISGEPVDDPFAQYLLAPEPAPIETPDDLLTPDAARDMYDGAVAGAWDMAAGTQRVTLVGDATDTEGRLWDQRYYGCGWEGVSGRGFPESADLSLLDVNVDAPSALSVSYGWVIDGNPVVNASVSNSSDWTLPFWGDAQPTLYLVKDGTVVAEGYLTNTSREGDVWIAEDAASSSLSIARSGYLAPGDGYSGEYLWRDVNGCWTESGQTEITSGTYTLLAAHTIHVDNGAVYYYDDYETSGGAATDDGALREESGSAGSAEDEPIMAPAPDEMGDYDWVELQVWTSLGTIRVTAS